MSNLDYKQFSRRRRPHYNPVNANLFTTFRLEGSIPKAIVRSHKAKLQWHRDQLRRVKKLGGETPSPELIEWLAKIESLNREWFIKTEEILHRAESGPMWLADPAVAEKVVENLHRLDGELYRLDSYSVMSNHVHTVFQPLFLDTDVSDPTRIDKDCLGLIEDAGLSQIMFLLKGRSARECNKVLNRSGSFWEHESFDHVIRSGKFDDNSICAQ